MKRNGDTGAVEITEQQACAPESRCAGNGGVERRLGLIAIKVKVSVRITLRDWRVLLITIIDADLETVAALLQVD